MDRIYPPGGAIASPIFIYLISITFITLLSPVICISQIDLPSLNPHFTKKTQNTSSEIGIHLGNFTISGDVAPQYSKSYGGGLYYRTAINHVVSIRYDVLFAKSNGLGAKPYKLALSNDAKLFEGYGKDNPYFFSFQTKVLSIGTDLLFELTNLAPQIKFNSWNLHFGIGIGLYNSSTSLNLKNSQNQPYFDLISKTSFDIKNEYNTRNGRKEIKTILEGIYDDSFETPGPKKSGVFRLGNETNITAYARLTFGISKKINNRFSLGIEYFSMFSDNDLLDGNRWRTESDLSNHNDVMHYFHLRIGYNLNPISTNSKIWTNPWQEHEENLKLEKEFLDSLAFDTDLDGVPDISDLEKNSLPNCPVDRDGIVLDSDNDGKPNCLDADPYLNDKLLEDKIEKIVDQLNVDRANSINAQNNSSNKHLKTILDSLLNQATLESLTNSLNLSVPNIYFHKNQNNFDRFGHKQIMTIVYILEQHPNIMISITGHSSDEGSDSYNRDLSLQRSSAVASFMVNNCNINPQRIQKKGLGSTNSRFANNDALRYLDRKVTFELFSGK